MLPLAESLNRNPFKPSTLSTCKHYWDDCFSRTFYSLRTFDRCLFHLQSTDVVWVDEGYSSFQVRKLRHPEVKAKLNSLKNTDVNLWLGICPMTKM